jgi:recombinational DNA repair ATPase RecF
VKVLLSRGSQWRRWDLHAHTPETILNDQFGNWEEYLAAIEAHPDIVTIGVTDYMSISNYSKLKEHKAKGRITNIKLLIPNIEFRIAPPSDKATALNIHLLVSPDESNHEEEILRALGRLDWRYGTGKYSCVPDQLIALGRAFDSSATNDKAALAIGVTQFKVDFTRFRDWYIDEPWLRKHSIVAVAAGDDGLSGFNRDGAWGGFREEVTRFSQVLFSGRPGEREFWLGRDTEIDRQTLDRLGGPKPVVQGSDAHKLADLFNPAQNRFCWLKADPTFEGFRQILYEPADRVFIGPTPPLYHDEARVISSVRISDANDWIDDITIPLNPGLVSIVGQKGSGKSALAELISYAAGSWQEDATSFLKRAGEHLAGLSIELQWADGAKSPAELWQEQSDNNEVRYLSQKFVERLCAEDQIGSELVREIEAVIFSYIDPTDTLNASDFDELRALRTEGIRSEGDRLREEISRLIREECALRANAKKLKEKEARIQTLTQERVGLLKQMPQPASKEEAQSHQELQARRTELVAKQQAMAAEKQKLQKIADIRTRLTAFKAQAGRFLSELDTLLKDVGVPDTDRQAFRLQFSADLEPPLARRAAEIQQGITTQEGSAESPAKGTVRWLEQQIKTLMERDTADKARQQRIKTIQTRVSAIATELERLNVEITQIKGPDRARSKCELLSS